MKMKTKNFVWVAAALLALLSSLCLMCCTTATRCGSSAAEQNYWQKAAEQIYWQQRVDPRNLDEVKRFAQKFGYNDYYYIVCDFGKRSGLKRFYVYDLNSRKLIMRSYCMHGSGSGSTPEKPVFSNQPGSYASCLGRFTLCGIGSHKVKNSIRLEGLDRTNSNASRRGILIHSAGVVTRFRGQEKYLPVDARLSRGCFTIEAGTLSQLKKIYRQHGRHERILLWACSE